VSTNLPHESPEFLLGHPQLQVSLSKTCFPEHFFSSQTQEHSKLLGLHGGRHFISYRHLHSHSDSINICLPEHVVFPVTKSIQSTLNKKVYSLFYHDNFTLWT